MFFFFFFQAEDGVRDLTVTGVQTCALPIGTRCGALEVGVVDVADEPGHPSRRGLDLGASHRAHDAGGAAAAASAAPSRTRCGDSWCTPGGRFGISVSLMPG